MSFLYKLIICCFIATVSFTVNAKVKSTGAKQGTQIKFTEIQKYLTDQKKIIVNDFKSRGDLGSIVFLGYYKYIQRVLGIEDLEKQTRVTRGWYQSLLPLFKDMYKAKQMIKLHTRKKNKNGVEAGYKEYKTAILKFQAALKKPIKVKKK